MSPAELCPVALSGKSSGPVTVRSEIGEGAGSSESAEVRLVPSGPGAEAELRACIDGLRAAGKQVVAIDYTHPSLAPNMWVNHGEIPGDGVDNDGNGFIDDYFGYFSIIQ